MIFAFALGVLTWTFAEYLIHRFDGHGMKGKTRFSREHLAHHADPTYFAPTRDKLLAGAVAGPVVFVVASVPLGWALGGGFTTGLLSMYGLYEVVHRRIHTHGPVGPFGRWARRHHLLHHHGNPAMNHGVTSPIWDWIFRTHRTTEIVGVPYRRAPVWLRDPDTGRVADSYAGDFEILGRAPTS